MEAVANEVSIAPGTGSASRHTRTGYVPGRGLYPAETDAALAAAPVGTILPPQPTPVGYLVVRVDSRKSPDQRQIEKMRETVRNELINKEYADEASRIEREQGRKVRTTVLLETFQSAKLPDPAGDAFEGWWALEAVPVARVGDVELTLGDLFRDFRDYAIVRNAPSGSQQPMFEEQRDEAVRAVLRYRHALERGLGASPEIDQALKEYEDNVLAAEYIASLVTAVRATDLGGDKCRVFFEDNKLRYASPEVFTLSQILVRRKEEEQLVLKELRDGKDFAALARKHSVAPEAAKGGDLGVLDARELEKRWPKEMVTDLIKVSLRGERGPVAFRTSEGFHILIIRDFKPKGFDFAASRKYVLPDCVEHFRQQAVTDRFAALRTAAVIEIDEQKLASIQPVTSPDGRVLYHGGGMSKPSGGASPHGSGSPHGGGHGTSPQGAPTPRGAPAR
jgi:parvulin-like peptidyl-prolyl isomerase